MTSTTKRLTPATSGSPIFEGFIFMSLSPCGPVKPAVVTRTTFAGRPPLGQCSGAPFRTNLESEDKLFISKEVGAKSLKTLLVWYPHAPGHAYAGRIPVR